MNSISMHYTVFALRRFSGWQKYSPQLDGEAIKVTDTHTSIFTWHDMMLAAENITLVTTNDVVCIVHGERTNVALLTRGRINCDE